MTKTTGSISEKGFCKACGKPFPSGTTRRRKFCNDTCRQAAHRHTTGKSARAGTTRVKTEIPARAKLGQPKALGDREWLTHEGRLLRMALAAHCRGGVIEVYHHKHGRGVLDLYRPFHDSQYLYRSPLFCTLSGQWKHLWVWQQARCQFDRPKRWVYLPWKEVWLLGWHADELPSNLRWVHKEDRKYRVRRRRTLNIDFDSVDIGYDPQNDCYVLYKHKPSSGPIETVLSELTEDTGAHHDYKKPQVLAVENLDCPDSDGDQGSD